MVRKIISTIGTKFLVAVISFFLVVLTTQFLGSAGRGDISLFMLNVAIVLLFCDFGGGPSMLYLIPRQGINKLFLPVYFWSIFSSAAVSALLFCFGLSQGLFIDLFLISLLLSLTKINMVFILGKENILFYNFLSLIQVLILAAGFFLLLNITDSPDYSSYIWALYVSGTITFLLSFIPVIKYFVPEKFQDMNKVLREIFRLGFFSQTGNIAQLFSYRLSFYFLNYFSGISFVGVYSTAVSIAEAVWLISKSISMVQYSRISNSTDIQYSRNLTVLLLKVTGVTTLISLFFMLLLPPSFFEFIFGKGFGDVRSALLWLSPGIAFFSLSGIFSHYFSGTGQMKVNTISSIIGFVLTALLGILLIPGYGIAGAGITASISFSASTLYQYFVFKKETGIGLGKMIPGIKDLKNFKELLWTYAGSGRESGENNYRNP